MGFEFRPAKREHVGLLIGLSGSSGSGKTYTAMRLAKGMAGDAPFAVIDTEAGRAKHYADAFAFDHGDLKPPFRPDAYAEAIATADGAGYPVIVVDSASHEWAGEGGILDWQDAELDRMAGSDWKKREACKMAAWIQPKMSHKRMVQRLLQVRAHLILCFRAEAKIEMVRGEGGRMEIREKQALTGLNGWIPISEKSLPYELTASFLLMADRPGIPLPIKLQEQHRALFSLDTPITEASGAALAAWARGGEGNQGHSTSSTLSTAREPGAASQPDHYRVTDVRRLKTGEKKGTAWELFGVTVHTGQTFLTFSTTVVDTADTARTSGEPIEIHTELAKNRKDRMITNIAPVVTDREIGEPSAVAQSL